MNRISVNIILMAMAVILASACASDFREEKTGTNVPEASADAVPGQLLVRFDASVADILDKTGLTKSASTKSGVHSVDEVLSILDGCTLERVFPYNGKTEDKAVKSGLNLWYIVNFPEGADAHALAAKLSGLGEVSRVEFNREIKRANVKPAIPLPSEAMIQATKAASGTLFNDPNLKYQWYLVNDGNLKPSKFIAGADVNVKGAWKKCTGHPDIIVAVVDEGVDCFHEDLQASMWVNEDEIWGSHEDNDGNGYAGDRHGFNFAQNSGVISTNDKYDSGHGTHVAGVIAAQNNNGVGISSIAGGDNSKPGVKIMSCQIFSGNKLATILDEVRAMKYAADNGAVVMQCSWGYVSSAANSYDWQPMYATDEQWKTYCPLEVTALDYFVHYAGSPDGAVEGGIVVFAGGNESAPAAGYPGAYGDFVSVAATAGDFTPAIYSNYGTGINISAPGGDQDYYYEYDDNGGYGAVGCILSTLPKTVAPSGYGYMEGTSMACPQVSGVIALGLSYAAQQRKHFKATEIIDYLYSSANEFESTWNIDKPKVYYRYVADIGLTHKSSIDLNNYRGKMGNGMVNADGLLSKISQTDAPKMTFPNVLLSLGAQANYHPSKYLDGNFSVKIDDESIASYAVSGNRLTFTGKKVGQTTASITGSSETHKFVITVRESSNSNGWL